MYQSTYFIDYFTQGIIKNPRINEILYVHQEIHTKQFLLCCLTCFVFVIHLNLNQLRFSGETMTQDTRESHMNMNQECHRILCHVTPCPIISRLKM